MSRAGRSSEERQPLVRSVSRDGEDGGEMDVRLEAGAPAGAAASPRGRRLLTLVRSAAALLALVLLFGLVVYLLKDYLRSVLVWVETQDPWLVLVVFIALFTVVSFPIAIGYLLLIITAGYLLGVGRGLATVLVSANIGVLIAHVTLRALTRCLPVATLVRGDAMRATLRVISGPQAYKIVLFTRLTPVPFGVQNTIFALSNVGGIRYHLATCIGLLPAQVINVYLGSTLRSMHDVFKESHVTGYIVFALQLTVGITLMIWVIQKARKELTLALLEAEMGHDGSLSASSSSASLIS